MSARCSMTLSMDCYFQISTAFFMKVKSILCLSGLGYFELCTVCDNEMLLFHFVSC